MLPNFGEQKSVGRFCIDGIYHFGVRLGVAISDGKLIFGELYVQIIRLVSPLDIDAFFGIG